MIAEKVEKKNVSFELEDDAELIAIEWNLDRVTVSEIMQYMVSIDLFECNDNRITCLKMAYRLDDTTSRNPHVIGLLERMTDSDTMESPETVGICRNSSTRLDKTRSDKKETNTSEPQAVSNARITKSDHESVIALYHEVLPELSAVMVSRWHGSAHAKHLGARWKEDEKFRTPEFWKAFFETVRLNSWWMGTPDKNTGASWDKCNLAWLVKRENFDKVLSFDMRKAS